MIAQIEAIMLWILLFSHDFSGKPVSIPAFAGTGFFPIVL